MWLFIKNRGYNLANYYKVEVSKSGSNSTVSIYNLSRDGEIILKRVSDILESEREDFIDYLKQMLVDKFIQVSDSDEDKMVWINKSLIKSIDVKPKNSRVIMVIEALNGFTETVDVAKSYPEFNLFWFRNWKSNVSDDAVLFVPSKDSAKRGKRGRIESVVNMF